MKMVARSRNEALRFIDRVCGELGPTWEPPQLIEIKRFKPPRSLPQNAVLHSMIRELASEVGHTEGELKDYFKDEFGPKKQFSFGDVDKMIPISTTEYTREQMSDFIGQIERVGAELGFRFSHE